MNQEPIENIPKNQVAPFSVTQAIQIYSESLKPSLYQREMVVSGFYKDTKRKEYYGAYYDSLLDVDNRSALSIKIMERIKSQLTDGECYDITGFITFNRKDSALQLLFNVTSIIGKNKACELISEDEYNLIKAKYDYGLRDIRSLIKENLRKDGFVNIAIVTGETSIVDKDFFKGLGDEAKSSYSIEFIKTNLSSASEILSSVGKCELNEYDFLVFMRGGGSGIEIFDDKNLCREIIELEKPFITAIGHEVDTPFLDKLSDLSFPTPSSFGTFLREMHDGISNEQFERSVQKKQINQLSTELQQQSINHDKKIQYLEAENKKQYLQFSNLLVKQRKIAMYIIAVLVIVLILVLSFK